MSDREVLYYTLKYGEKYYAPYLSLTQGEMSTSVQAMLTDKKHLAVRFGDKETADYFKKTDIKYRTLYQESGFDPKQVKVVAVYKKIHTIN